MSLQSKIHVFCYLRASCSKAWLACNYCVKMDMSNVNVPMEGHQSKVKLRHCLQYTLNTTDCKGTTTDTSL
jgi:hypothetical protein